MYTYTTPRRAFLRQHLNPEGGFQRSLVRAYGWGKQKGYCPPLSSKKNLLIPEQMSRMCLQCPRLQTTSREIYELTSLFL